MDGAEISAIHEEVGSEGMAESVGTDMLGDAGEPGVFLDDAFDGTWGEAAVVAGSVNGLLVFAVVEKKGGKGILAGVEILANAVGGGFGDEDWAIFATFTTNHEFTTIEVNAVTVEIGELGDTEATRIKKLDNGTVAKTVFGVGRNGI